MAKRALVVRELDDRDGGLPGPLTGASAGRATARAEPRAGPKPWPRPQLPLERLAALGLRSPAHDLADAGEGNLFGRRPRSGPCSARRGLDRPGRAPRLRVDFLASSSSRRCRASQPRPREALGDQLVESLAADLVLLLPQRDKSAAARCSSSEARIGPPLTSATTPPPSRGVRRRPARGVRRGRLA